MNDTYSLGPRAALLTLILLLLVAAGVGAQDSNYSCQPTPSDALGPYYEPDAPRRSSVGEGYVLTGVVRSAEDCRELEGAVIEFWMAGVDGRYSDEYRAVVLSDEFGQYRFESHPPVPYGGRPPHIHIRVTAYSHEPLVSQHYPELGDTANIMELVLRPDE